MGLITFGGKAQMHLPLVAAHGVAGFSEFKADGVTPMGAAFDLARQLLEVPIEFRLPTGRFHAASAC